MRERGDLDCFHEPFMYDYYVARQKRVMPFFKAEKGRPVTYRQVRDVLIEAAEKSPVFVKDMSYYVIPHMLDDPEFCARLTNTFLIRDPVASIMSYFKLDPDINCEEVGLQAQARHYQALHNSGQKPIVVQAEDVRAGARRVVTAYWKAIGLKPANHAFNWQGAKPDDWKQVDGWHIDVSASKGILPTNREEMQTQLNAKKDEFAALARQHPKLQALLDYHLPHYEMLKSNALKI